MLSERFSRVINNTIPFQCMKGIRKIRKNPFTVNAVPRTANERATEKRKPEEARIDIDAITMEICSRTSAYSK